MKDPYEVLGVDRNASIDEIKLKYKELVKQYHPDKYRNNPLASLAEEKMKDINEAYDYLMKNHSGGGGSNGGYGGGNYGGGGSYSGSYSQGGTDPQLQRVRQMMNSGNIAAAESELNRCGNRNAEWFFLSGMISYRKGWQDDAIQKMQTAVRMDPTNQEYRQGLNSIMNVGGAYRNTAYGRGYNSSQDMLCTLCQAYICFDCLCDCI